MCTFVKPDFRYHHQQEETPNTHLWLSASFPLDPVCHHGFMGTLSLPKSTVFCEVQHDSRANGGGEARAFGKGL